MSRDDGPSRRPPRGRSGVSQPDNAAQAVEDLRAATRAAHEALKDLRTERIAVEKERQRVKQLADGIDGLIRRRVDQIMTESVSKEISDLAEIIAKFQHDAYEKVMGEFDKLMNVIMGWTDDGNPTLQEMVIGRMAEDPVYARQLQTRIRKQQEKEPK